MKMNGSQRVGPMYQPWTPGQTGYGPFNGSTRRAQVRVSPIVARFGGDGSPQGQLTVTSAAGEKPVLSVQTDLTQQTVKVVLRFEKAPGRVAAAQTLEIPFSRIPTGTYVLQFHYGNGRSFAPDQSFTQLPAF
jgi:hypothetical protein